MRRWKRPTHPGLRALMARLQRARRRLRLAWPEDRAAAAEEVRELRARRRTLMAATEGQPLEVVRVEGKRATKRKRRIKVPDAGYVDLPDGRGGFERVGLHVDLHERRQVAAMDAAAARLEGRAEALTAGRRGRPLAWVAREVRRLLARAAAVREAAAAARRAWGAAYGQRRTAVVTGTARVEPVGVRYRVGDEDTD